MPLESDPTALVATLSTTLSSLESALAPLLKLKLAELNEQHKDDNIGKAKLAVMIAYVVHDLVWVYLRTAGVDPNNHPVIQELDRLKIYFEKLAHAEKSGSVEGDAEPSTSTSATTSARQHIDKEAASRFIAAAIGGSRTLSPASGSASPNPKGKHTRFEAEAINAAVDKVLESEDSEADDQDAAMNFGEKKGETGTAKNEEKKGSQVSTGGASNSRRPQIDPFTGYDKPKPSPSSKVETLSPAKRTGDYLSKKERKKLAKQANSKKP
ncbi:hypothetical protein T439DRAFT_134063 [Meredithblackwellia eburnea MCA 4105]